MLFWDNVIGKKHVLHHANFCIETKTGVVGVLWTRAFSRSRNRWEDGLYSTELRLGGRLSSLALASTVERRVLSPQSSRPSLMQCLHTEAQSRGLAGRVPSYRWPAVPVLLRFYAFICAALVSDLSILPSTVAPLM